MTPCGLSTSTQTHSPGTCQTLSGFQTVLQHLLAWQMVYQVQIASQIPCLLCYKGDCSQYSHTLSLFQRNPLPQICDYGLLCTPPPKKILHKQALRSIKRTPDFTSLRYVFHNRFNRIVWRVELIIATTCNHIHLHSVPQQCPIHKYQKYNYNKCFIPSCHFIISANKKHIRVNHTNP